MDIDDIKVVKSKRARRHRIEVSVRGVKVVIPEGSGIDPRQIIADKRQWIEKKIAKFESQRRRIPERKFEAGACWPYLGDDYSLAINGEKNHKIVAEEIVLAEKKVNKSTVKDELEKFYRKQARSYFTSLVEDWAGQIKVNPNRIFIRNQRTRWGSCSSKNNLNFNFRLIMAPPPVVEYMIVHELCHLRERNHGAKFKQLLEFHCPGYRKQERWLKENSVELIFTRNDL